MANNIGKEMRREGLPARWSKTAIKKMKQEEAKKEQERKKNNNR